MIKSDKNIKPVVWYVILALIILVGCIRLVFLFSQRNGHHVDETWTYGFANSYYEPNIYGDIGDDNIKNTGEWVSGEVFKDYVSVSDDHRFAFDSVMYNKRGDLSPALYALILHFVSSFFPGKFSWWFAFSINLVCFVLTLVLIYLCIRDCSKSEICGLASVLFYVFSGAGTSDFLYLRVYSLFTLLAFAEFRLIQRILNDRFKNKVIGYVLLFTINILGAFTHYYFLILAFWFTAISAIILLLGKKYKKFFAVCGVMLASVIVYFVVYHPALEQLLPYAGGKTATTSEFSYPYYMDLAVANVRFFNGAVGFCIPFSIYGLSIFFGIVALAAVMVFLIHFLFRNEEWMKNAEKKFKDWFNNAVKSIPGQVKGSDPSLWVAFFSSVFYLLIVPYTANIVNMGFVERYFFPAMSVFVIAFASFCCYVCRIVYSVKDHKALKGAFTVSLALVLAFLCYRSSIYTEDFRFRTMNDSQIADAIRGRDCYVLINSERDLIWYSPILAEAENVYVDFQRSFNSDEVYVPELDDNDVLLILKNGVLTDEQKNELMSDPEMLNLYFQSYGTFKTYEEILGVIEDRAGKDYIKTSEFFTFIGRVELFAGE